MGMLAWIVLGFIAGLIARVIYPGQQPGGSVVTVLLGIAGALVGGWVGQAFGGPGASGELSFGSLLTAVAGSLLVLFLWGLVSGRSRLRRRTA